LEEACGPIPFCPEAPEPRPGAGGRSAAFACDTPVSVCATGKSTSLALIQGGRPASVYVDPTADPAVRRAAEGLREDLGRVGGGEATKLSDLSKAGGPTVIIGVLGASPAIDALVKSGKLKVEDLAGQWEGFRQVVVERPVAGVPRALVIVGADRRGAVFGAYDLSERIGVSPWSWWADVPVTPEADLFLTAGARADHPRVKYRGFFINDEDPAFSGWAKAKFGGINADLYAHVFDLTLRLKGNYLWPAMWAPKAFNDDDPRNKVLADEMGVVMGSSHHEPMTRAQAEWHRNTDKGVTGGRWDYASQRRQPAGLLARRHRADDVEGRRHALREPGDGGHARRRRRADGRGRGHPAAGKGRGRPAQDHRRGDRQAARKDAPGLGALQGGAGLLRPRHAGAGRRDPAVLRRQLGPDPAAARGQRAGRP
jgi:hypothetical protein